MAPHRDNSVSVADGLAKTARVITSAAAIMICVFGSFVIGDPLRILKVFGLGLAAAIFIDATLVRLVLVPSVMELLGRSNWYMPRWLDRIVPTLGVEVDVDASLHRADDPGPAPPDAGVSPTPVTALRVDRPSSPGATETGPGSRTVAYGTRRWSSTAWARTIFNVVAVTAAVCSGVLPNSVAERLGGEGRQEEREQLDDMTPAHRSPRHATPRPRST